MSGPKAGLRSQAVRQANLGTVLRALHRDGPVTRSDLRERSGLTRSAIGELVHELADLGLVTESPSPTDGTRGRPSPLVQVTTGRNVALAFEVMVESIAVAPTR